MISQTKWFQDSPNTFDVSIYGVGGDGTRAGCNVDLISPAGFWHLKASDFAQPYADNKISFTHGSSSVNSVPAGTQFIFGSYADNNQPNVPAVKTGESQTGPLLVPGWYTNQTIAVISQLDPRDPSTWTWLINYNGHKL